MLTKIRINHTGYQDDVMRMGKLERNGRLLELDAAEFPDDPYPQFNLGMLRKTTHGPDVAIEYLERSIQLSRVNVSYLPKAYGVICQLLLNQGKKAEAERKIEEALNRFPDDAYLLHTLGLVHQAYGRTNEANECFRQAGSKRRNANLSGE